jgi:hypothetical protein
MTSKPVFGPVLARHVNNSFDPLIRERKSIDLSRLNRLEDQFRRRWHPNGAFVLRSVRLFCGHPGFLRFLRLLLAISKDSCSLEITRTRVKLTLI